MLTFYLSAVEMSDRDKITQIYNEYKDCMWYTANGILKDAQNAEDAVHEAFLKIIDNLHKIDEVPSARCYWFVNVIVKNTAISMYNKLHKISQVSFEDLLYDVGDTQTPEKELIAKITPELISAELQNMKEPLRETLILHLEYAYNDREIAQLLGITPQNARKRLQRAREQLMALLKKEAIL